MLIATLFYVTLVRFAQNLARNIDKLRHVSFLQGICFDIVLGLFKLVISSKNFVKDMNEHKVDQLSAHC